MPCFDHGAPHGCRPSSHGKNIRSRRRARAGSAARPAPPRSSLHTKLPCGRHNAIAASSRPASPCIRRPHPRLGRNLLHPAGTSAAAVDDVVRAHLARQLKRPSFSHGDHTQPRCAHAAPPPARSGLPRRPPPSAHARFAIPPVQPTRHHEEARHVHRRPGIMARPVRRAVFATACEQCVPETQLTGCRPQLHVAVAAEVDRVPDAQVGDAAPTASTTAVPW